MIGYFITGTDTNVGKTYVTCALARRGRALGNKVFAFKPIESGCPLGPAGEHIGPDQELLVAAAGDWQRGRLRGLYRFPVPAAPFVAAEAAQTIVDLRLVTEVTHEGAREADVSLTLVEGAGGWRVPITAGDDMSALARELGLPVVIVARAGLGTINHTLLTVEAIQRDGQLVAAVILSQRAEEEPEVSERNRVEIVRRWPGRVMIFGSKPEVLDCLVPVAPLCPT